MRCRAPPTARVRSQDTTRGRVEKKADLRGSRNTQHIELGLIETHITEGQTGKHTREEDKDGDEACEDDELDIVRLVLAFCEEVGGRVGGERRDADML